MGRIARGSAGAEYWHIMLRGIGHMDLFMEEEDYARFIDTVRRFAKDSDVDVYAYCLMSNHVHILAKADASALGAAFQKIEVSYSYYFNHKYEHIGHLFHNRYKSEPIRDESYLLSAFRYILRNPEAAGICIWEKYAWSCAKHYIGADRSDFPDTGFITDIFGGTQPLIAFVSSEPDIALCEPEGDTFAVKDIDVKAKIQSLTGKTDLPAIQKMEKTERDKLLALLKEEGLSIRQIERTTGINRNIIQRAK